MFTCAPMSCTVCSKIPGVFQRDLFVHIWSKIYYILHGGNIHSLQLLCTTHSFVLVSYMFNVI